MRKKLRIIQNQMGSEKPRRDKRKALGKREPKPPIVAQESQIPEEDKPKE
jgi:hypothetical protein